MRTIQDRVASKFTMLNESAPEACAQMVKRFSQLVGFSDVTHEQVVSVIAKDVRGHLVRRKRYSYGKVIDIVPWHRKMGEIVVFDTLFGVRIDAECRSNLENWKQDICRAFDVVKSSGLGDVHDQVLSHSMHDFALDFGDMVNQLLGRFKKSKKMTEDQVYVLDDELMEIEMYRGIGTYAFYGARYLGSPPMSTAWMDLLTHWDEPLKVAVRRFEYESKRLFPQETVSLDALTRARFEFPPEVFPWGRIWAKLEAEEGKTIPEILGFNPKEVKTRLDQAISLHCE